MIQSKYSCPLIQNKISIERLLNKEGYEAYSFNDVFIDVTSKGRKIKTNDYHETGKYPIVDQSNDFIGGYIDEKDDLFENYPVIIFGDHTRCLKYVDFSFHLGADGVKVLKNKIGEEKASTYFLYYYLKNIYIPNTGYNRHFKYIKEILFVLPPLETQEKIVEVLDKAQRLIDARKEQIRLMDKLIQSVFYEMFGDPVTNPKGWAVKKLGDLFDKQPQNGMYKPQCDYVTNGTGTPILRIDAFYNGKIENWNLKRLNCDEEEVKKYGLEVDDIVINRVNSIEYLGKCAHIDKLIEPTVYESNMMRFSVDKKVINPFYLSRLLSHQYIYNQILVSAKKAVNQASINQQDVKSFDIVIPDIDLQNLFASKVNEIEKQKNKFIESSQYIKKNYQSIISLAFKGELF